MMKNLKFSLQLDNNSSGEETDFYIRYMALIDTDIAYLSNSSVNCYIIA